LERFPPRFLQQQDFRACISMQDESNRLSSLSVTKLNHNQGVRPTTTLCSIVFPCNQVYFQKQRTSQFDSLTSFSLMNSIVCLPFQSIFYLHPY
jgi:hypothetical protein